PPGSPRARWRCSRSSVTARATPRSALDCSSLRRPWTTTYRRSWPSSASRTGLKLRRGSPEQLLAGEQAGGAGHLFGGVEVGRGGGDELLGALEGEDGG